MIVKEKASFNFGDSLFIKAVVDIERRIISLDCDLHFDCAEELVKDGSKYADLWGANIYPQEKKIDFISLINIRPIQNNRSMDIGNVDIRKKVDDTINSLLF